MTPNTERLIKHFESLHDGDLTRIGLQPKLCPAGVWTEGWGRAIVDPVTKKHLRGAANRARALQLSSIKTASEADAALREDYERLGAGPARRQVGQAVWDRLNPEQRGALASFVYNCGVGDPRYLIFRNVTAFVNGTMTARALAEYWERSIIRIGRTIQPGLVRRRRSEAVLFLTGQYDVQHDDNWLSVIR